MTVFALLRRVPDEADPQRRIGATARELVIRGTPFSEAERRVLAEAWYELAEAPLRDGWDAEVARECHKQYRLHRAALTVPAYSGVTPFDVRIAETETELATVAAAELAARDALQRASDEVRVDMIRRRTDEPARALVEQRQAMLEAHREGERHFTRIRSRLTALEVSRSHWRAAQV